MKRTLGGTVKTSARASRARAARASGRAVGRTDAVLARARGATLGDVRREQIDAALRLLIDEQCTLPFVARYRKERTDGLDEGQLRAVAAAHAEWTRLESKRESAFEALTRLEIVDERLFARLREASAVETIEDLMSKYKTKTSSRADRARELGCEPLAEKILSDGAGGVEALARAYVNGNDVPDVCEALRLAKDVLAERAANETSAREAARRSTWQNGRLQCALTTNGKAAVEGKIDDKKMKKIADALRDYYEFNAPLRRVKPHQTLAILRGEAAKVLRVKIDFDVAWATSAAMKAMVGSRRLGGGCYNVVSEAVEDGVKRLLAPSIEREAKSRLKTEAMERAIADFGANLRSLLLQPPLTPAAVVLGVDPAYRTGCKLAVVDPTGALLDTGVVHLPQFESKVKREGGGQSAAASKLQALVKQWNVKAIAIGDGVASRETESLVATALAGFEGVGWRVVSEAGASVYSASEIAAKELPDIDVSLRGAVSIARRLQDPMAELVKIEPQSIGIGLYQHDVKEKELADALTATVESAVANVGANLNTSSQSLLSRIPGLGPSLAAKIVRHRSERGRFRERAALKTIAGVGAKTYEQIIGFLRVPDAKDALERTSVHPESYHIAKKLLKMLERDVAEVIDLTASDAGDTSMDALKRLKPKLKALRDDVKDLEARAARLKCHPLTLKDIANELSAPGDDARGQAAEQNVLRTQALTLEDLQTGAEIKNAVVRNVVPFGCFLDLGVGRDALLHVTAMRKRTDANPNAQIDPHALYRVGQTCAVRVKSVDIARQRIAVELP
jgi:uncharacterized protein